MRFIKSLINTAFIEMYRNTLYLFLNKMKYTCKWSDTYSRCSFASVNGQIDIPDAHLHV